MTANGGCLCGACRYTADGAPINVRVCHCKICQKATGAAFNARVLYRLEQVKVAGPVGRVNSSENLVRGFCTRCGTTLFSERESAGVIGMTFGSLDDPDVFQPTEHIWTASKQAWVKLDDGLPQHPGANPA